MCDGCKKSWDEMHEANYDDVDAMQGALWASKRARYFALRERPKIKKSNR
jgi:hypothetical protein